MKKIVKRIVLGLVLGIVFVACGCEQEEVSEVVQMDTIPYIEDIIISHYD